MTPYLYEHQNRFSPVRANGRRFWGYPKRTARIDLIAIHTTESTFDLIGQDTGAENVAAFQSTTERPSSYHRIVDRDSTIVCLPDEATAFGVIGYNSRTLSLALALRGVDWSDPVKAAAAEPMLRRAAVVVAEWCRVHGVPPVPVSKPQADAGKRGITSHGQLDPARRSDPGAAFPWARFLELVRQGTPTPTPTPPVQEDDMTPQQDEMLKLARADAANAAQIASEVRNWLLDPKVGVLFQLGVVRGLLDPTRLTAAVGEAVRASGGDVDEAALARELLVLLAAPVQP
ncbi:MAG TPA: N-acetylmuramoyl-L-alanine amidase [Plantibacter sp.]|uniref:N-acetylmuramoyl-L-alanine amidase n=1 Tax=Plantibacter sp. TaxID=1871045 RepID=UPI002CE5F5C1|nr:N-acetylmuramoyl-L-alanine amidase [Plantibacter sp.]